jgi:sugar phosphate isomerase/epimerase
MLPGGLTPSPGARELVRGAYDLHVHVAPDVMRRRVTDLELAREFRRHGLAGFVLKSHYVSTAERAAVVRAAVPGVRALGAITLNAAVGGLNPVAVEIAAREGARVVWLPTVDAANHRRTARDLPPGATPPMWLALQEELRGRGLDPAPVEVLDAAGVISPQARAILELIAGHGLVLATGHLGRAEIMAVTRAAVEAGVAHIMITHPEFPQQALGADDQRRLAGQGAFLERCLTTPLTGKYPWPDMVANIRAAGPESTVITTDLGQPHNPPVQDGLALMADALAAAGFTDKEIRRMIVDNSRLLAGPDPAGDGS